MSPDRSNRRDDEPSAATSLDAAVPAQEWAKFVLRSEFSVFRAHRGDVSLVPQPVLLWGNHPGRIPAALVRALARESGLPWVEAPVWRGVCVEQIISQVAKQAAHCHEDRPLGIALLSDLENVPLEAAHALARQLTGTGRLPHVHQGRVVGLSPRQIFWVVALRVPPPTRLAGPPPGPDAGTSFALLAVGPEAADVLAAGMAGPGRFGRRDAEVANDFGALAHAFKANAMILPGTTDDLVAWARAENAPWWPGRQLRTYCEHHGTAFVMGQGAAEALATEAASRGGTIDVMEERLRAAMHPVLAAIADARCDYAAVEITPASLTDHELPRLMPGPRQAPGVGPEPPVEEVYPSGIERPPRTPMSSPDIRLARAEDLRPILSPIPPPATP